MKSTKIEWTDKTWYPITGCTKHSAGCAHCYTEVMSRRLHAMGLAKYANGFQLTMHEDALNEPSVAGDAGVRWYVLELCVLFTIFAHLFNLKFHQLRVIVKAGMFVYRKIMCKFANNKK